MSCRVTWMQVRVRWICFKGLLRFDDGCNVCPGDGFFFNKQVGELLKGVHVVDEDLPGGLVGILDQRFDFIVDTEHG